MDSVRPSATWCSVCSPPRRANGRVHPLPAASCPCSPRPSCGQRVGVPHLRDHSAQQRSLSRGRQVSVPRRRRCRRRGATSGSSRPAGRKCSRRVVLKVVSGSSHPVRRLCGHRPTRQGGSRACPLASSPVCFPILYSAHPVRSNSLEIPCRRRVARMLLSVR